MPQYRYTGADERIPAPPLQGDLIPGETVHSEEPVDHPDLEPAGEEPLDETYSTAGVDIEDTPRPRARARAKE